MASSELGRFVYVCEEWPKQETRLDAMKKIQLALVANGEERDNGWSKVRAL